MDQSKLEVAISFAGEDRPFAKALAEALDNLGIRVFYDQFPEFKVELWGKDLPSHFMEIFLNNAEYCVPLISKHFKEKPYAMFELKAALARELQDASREYILPIRLDDTPIPGLLPTKGYLKWPPEDSESIAKIIMVKIGKWPDSVLKDKVLYQAIQKLAVLANQEPKTAELLSAGTLRNIYLNCSKYIPSDSGKKVIFQNLLLRGRGKTRNQRAVKLETETSLASPGALGWYWFNDLHQEEALILIRHCSNHPNIHVRAGSARALGLFGNENDRDLLKSMFTDNANVAAMAIRSLSNIGVEEDINLIFNFQDDKRVEVRKALAYAIARYGIIEGESICYKLLNDPNNIVQREAVIALGILTIKNNILMNKTISNLDSIIDTSDGQVLAAAIKVRKRLTGEPIDTADCYEKYIRKAHCYHRFDENYTINSSIKSRRLLLIRPSPSQDAAIQWLIRFEIDAIDSIINELGPQLTFYVLRELDYYVYCPKWWQSVMSKPFEYELYK